MRVTRLGWHTVNILARSHTRTMSHCLPSKGTVLRLFNIIVQWKFKGQLSHAHLARVGHKALANFIFIARIFRSRIGDSRRLSATVGMYTSGRGPKKVHLLAAIHMYMYLYKIALRSIGSEFSFFKFSFLSRHACICEKKNPLKCWRVTSTYIYFCLSCNMPCSPIISMQLYRGYT